MHFIKVVISYYEFMIMLTERKAEFELHRPAKTGQLNEKLLLLFI